MNRDLIKEISIYFSYLVVGVLSMALAFYLATSFVDIGEAQTPPPPPPPPADGAAAAAPQAGQPTTPAAGAPTEGSVVAGAEKARANFMAEVESYLEPFIYDPKGRRDPFRPYQEVVIQRNDGFEGPLLPLQRFDLDQLNLLGIIWDIRDPKAMFKDPNGEIHIVGLEERIGRKNGYIAVIREGEGVIVEASRRKGDVIFPS